MFSSKTEYAQTCFRHSLTHSLIPLHLSSDGSSLGVVYNHPRSHGDENLENKKRYGKVMEDEKFAKSLGILLSVMEFYHICPRIVPNLYVLCHH